MIRLFGELNNVPGKKEHPFHKWWLIILHLLRLSNHQQTASCLQLPLFIGIIFRNLTNAFFSSLPFTKSMCSSFFRNAKRFPRSKIYPCAGKRLVYLMNKYLGAKSKL